MRLNRDLHILAEGMRFMSEVGMRPLCLTKDARSAFEAEKRPPHFGIGHEFSSEVAMRPLHLTKVVRSTFEVGTQPSHFITGCEVRV